MPKNKAHAKNNAEVELTTAKLAAIHAAEQIDIACNRLLDVAIAYDFEELISQMSASEYLNMKADLIASEDVLKRMCSWLENGEEETTMM